MGGGGNWLCKKREERAKEETKNDVRGVKRGGG